MEEYIQLMVDEAQRHFETNFPAIFYNDASTSNQNVSSEPTVSIYNAIKSDIDFHILFSDSEDEDYTFIYNKDSSSYQLIPINDLKPKPVNEHVEINIESCSENIDIKPMDSITCTSNDTTPVEFDKNIETNHDTPGFNTAYPREQMRRIEFLYKGLKTKQKRVKLRVQRYEERLSTRSERFSVSRVLEAHAEGNDWWIGIYRSWQQLSLSPSPILVEDSDPFMEEIDIFLASDDSTPPGVESDYDSEGDILLLEELLNDDLVPLAEYNHFTFDVEPDTAVKNDFDELNEDECFDPGGRFLKIMKTRACFQFSNHPVKKIENEAKTYEWARPQSLRGTVARLLDQSEDDTSLACVIRGTVFHRELLIPTRNLRKKFVLLRICRMIIHLHDRHKNVILKLLIRLLSLSLHLLSPLRIVTLLWRRSTYFLLPMTRCHQALRSTTMTRKGFLEELLSNDSTPLPENESFSLDYFDDPSLPRPPPEPPDVEICFNFKPDAGVVTKKVVGDISEHDVPMPNLLPTQPTLCPVFDLLLLFSSENEDKVFKPGIFSSPFSSHRAKITFDFSERPMMISGGDIPHLDVPYLHFYPP
ncbi:hypothetical protein Tco_0798646 [Tanacetum coccineum]